MKVIHYYHIYCGGNWQLILNQHMMAVCNYGLINVLDEIRVGIVGPPEQRKAVKEVLEGSMVADKVKVVVTRTNARDTASTSKLPKRCGSTLRHIGQRSRTTQGPRLYSPARTLFHSVNLWSDR